MSNVQQFEELHLASMREFNSTNCHHLCLHTLTNAGFNYPPATSTPLVNPMDPPPPTDFDAAMAEVFSFTPSADHVQPSYTTYMPDVLDLPPLVPTDQAATWFHPSLPNQSPALPMTSFATSGLQDASNANFINFAADDRDASSIQKDKRSIGSIVRAECRRLCGAIEYTTTITRRNSGPVRIRKYILPDPDTMPRRDASGMLLHNPQWKKPATNSVNKLFIDAVVDAVQLVHAESTVGCERAAIRKVARTYFRQLSITHADQTA